MKKTVKNNYMLNAANITPDFFLKNFMDIIIMYIARGNPTNDTIVTYKSAINQFIQWCAENSCDMFSVTDYQMRMYQQYLYKKQYKNETMTIKIIAIRAFFNAAVKLNLMAENPCREIKLNSTYTSEGKIHFLSVDQIGDICDTFNEEKDPFLKFRNILMVYLMGVEGLRNIEVQRANREDIDWNVGSIFVRGKGHNRQIYPCRQTFKIIDKYLQHCPTDVKKENDIFTPLILSDSNQNLHGRISRKGIRYIINRSLERCNLKVKGLSCHALRHSCGTNLYAVEKDLRLIQEVLGHRDPKTTARYAHLQERISYRSTEKIIPRHK